MSLKSLIATGTKVWLDSIDPPLVKKNRAAGATGATSNPIIVADIIKVGAFDDEIAELAGGGKADDEIAWAMTDHLVKGRAGRLPADLGGDQGEQRVRQLRVGPAAGGQGEPDADRRRE